MTEGWGIRMIIAIPYVVKERKRAQAALPRIGGRRSKKAYMVAVTFLERRSSPICLLPIFLFFFAASQR